MEKYYLDAIDDIDRLDRILSRGEKDVYCYISDYHVILEDQKIMFWNLDEESTVRDYFQAREDI